MAMSTANENYVVQDLDEETSFRTALSQIAASHTSNFAIYFDHKEAIAAVNLTCDSLIQWFQGHDNQLGTRWIHFWTDATQRSSIEAIASRYDISPRLVGLLCPQPGRSISSSRADIDMSPRANSALSPTNKDHTNSVESLLSENGTRLQPISRTSSGLKELTFGDIVSDLWHFHSVDWGEKYIHIGVNVLSVVPGLSHSVAKPAGQRLWMSLVLCHDGLVLSTIQRPQIVEEDPEMTQLANKIGKRHILDVLSQLSRLVYKSSSNNNDLTGINVRPNPRTSNLSTDAMYKERTECSSLLFYYLFDDWMSTYALIARREHPYRANLEKVRQILITAPDVHELETLHNIGRQLVVLRSMYESYAAVVTRLLTRYNSAIPVAMTAAALSTNADCELQVASRPHSLYEERNSPSQTTLSPRTTFMQRPSMLPEKLVTMTAPSSNHPIISTSALFRFERLLDRIHLYALSEIKESIAEKESLSLMTFNLLTLSESHTIEKLTRTTILLAKATILFLPVSLLTGYFGISVGEVASRYTLKTYWLSFLVVLVTSVLFLSLFQAAMGSVQGQLGFVSLRRALWRKGVAKWAKRRKEKEMVADEQRKGVV